MLGTELPDRRHSRFVELDRFAVWQDVNDLRDAFRAQHRREHSDPVAVCTWNFVRRKRFGFGAHDRGPHIRCDLDYSIDATRQIFGFRFCLAARFGEMLVTYAAVAKQLRQHQSVELRPARSRDATDVAQKFDLVFLKQFKKIREGMAAVADGVDC